MEPKKYCPTCLGELEKLGSCGTVGYFCDHCKTLVSKSKMLTEEEKNEIVSENKYNAINEK